MTTNKLLHRCLCFFLLLGSTSVSADVFINAGGPANGIYSADKYYTGGDSYTFGVQAGGVYSTERWSKTGFSYAIPVIPGQVQITLKFRESCVPCEYTRIFNVAVEGQRILTNFQVPP